MKNEVFDSLARRTLFFSKVILTFLVISVLIFINYLDLQEMTRNGKYLVFLVSVYEKGDENLRFENFELERVLYLGNKNPALGDPHVITRNSVTNILNSFGASIDKRTKGQSESVNKFVLMANRQLLLEIKQDFETSRTSGAYLESNRIDYIDFDRLATVDSAISLFRKYSVSEKMYFVTGIDTALLIQKLDSATERFNPRTSRDLSHEMNDENSLDFVYVHPVYPTTIPDTISVEKGHNYGITVNESVRRNLLNGNLEFQGVFLYKDAIIVTFGERDIVIQGELKKYFITVPAKIDSLTIPSTLQFAGFDPSISDELSNNQDKLNQLKSTYGYWPITMIPNMASEIITKHNDAVSILGFDVSRKWYPLAMFLVLVIVYSLLYETVKTAKQSQFKIISDHVSEEVLVFMVYKKAIRFSIWVLTPLLLLIIVFCSTLIHYSLLVYGVLFLCMAICSILGFTSYKYSLRL